eukprot:549623-Prorocentrum_minimum.AAC.4
MSWSEAGARGDEAGARGGPRQAVSAHHIASPHAIGSRRRHAASPHAIGSRRRHVASPHAIGSRRRHMPPPLTRLAPPAALPGGVRPSLLIRSDILNI